MGRPELTIHDLRHSGLTWSAATGAPLAELMRRGGHKDSRAAIRYQQATRDSGKVLADALAALSRSRGPIEQSQGGPRITQQSQRCRHQAD